MNLVRTITSGNTNNIFNLKSIYHYIIILLLFGCESKKQLENKRGNFNICDSLLKNQTNHIDELKPVYEIIQKDSVFEILSPLNFNKDNWVILMRIDGYKDETIKTKFGLPKRGYYYLNDIDVMKKMQDDWTVVNVNSGDCCTPDFSMQFYRNGKEVYNVGLIVDDNSEGFQDDIFGWSPVTNQGIIKKYLQNFILCNDEEL